MKYVWLNIKTGEFSNTWDERLHQQHGKGILEGIEEHSYWKLIRYECLNDTNFQFNNLMEIK